MSPVDAIGPKQSPPPKIKKPPKISNRDVLFEWRAPEFSHYKKNKWWFIKAGIAIGILIAFSIFIENYFGAVVILVLGVIIFLYSIRKPAMIKYRITRDGIQIDRRFYFFRDLENFYILYEPPDLKKINFRSKRFFVPMITMELGKQNPVKARRVLLKYLAEDLDAEESLTDRLSRRLRF